MPSCFIKTCKISYKNKPNDVTFHRFPMHMKQAWLSAMGRDPALDISHSTVICSMHFKRKDFLEYGAQRRLKKDSIPSLKLQPVPRQNILVAPSVQPTVTVLSTINSSAERANEFSTACRTCLRSSENMRSLYEVCTSSIKICFAEMLLSFIPLKSFGNDGLPAQICCDCISELNICIAFKLKCLKSDAILRNWLDEGKTEEVHPIQEVVINTEEFEDCSLKSPLTKPEIADIMEQKIDLIDHDIKIEEDLHPEINNTKMSYNCTHCEKSFRRNGFLMMHMRRKHTGEKPYSCKVCKKTFGHKSTLTAQKRYSCTVCDKLCREKPTLNIHQRKYMEERPCSCVVCDNSSNHKSTLTSHMRKHTGDRLYACVYCGLSFPQHPHLTTHLRHSCTVCNNRCTHRCHIRLHTGETSICCNCS